MHNLQGGQGLRPFCPLADGRVHQRRPGLEAIRGEGGDGPAEDDGPEEGREGVVGDEVGALRGGHAPRGHVGLDDVLFLGHCGWRPFSLVSLTLPLWASCHYVCCAGRFFELESSVWVVISLAGGKCSEPNFLLSSSASSSPHGQVPAFRLGPQSMFLPEVLLQPRWGPGSRVMLTNGLQGFVCVRLAGIRAKGLQKMGVAVLEVIAVPTVWFLDGLDCFLPQPYEIRLDEICPM